MQRKGCVPLPIEEKKEGSVFFGRMGCASSALWKKRAGTVVRLRKCRTGPGASLSPVFVWANEAGKGDAGKKGENMKESMRLALVQGGSITQKQCRKKRKSKEGLESRKHSLELRERSLKDRRVPGKTAT